VADLVNEFSWSRTRDNVFQECRRRYYYQYYGAWGGWDVNSDPLVRRLYILKQLATRQMWIGRLVHEAVERCLLALRDGHGLSEASLIEDTVRQMRAEWKGSRAGLYRETPKRPSLFEHEYAVPIKDSEWQALRDHLVRCLRTELTTGPDIREPLEISASRPEDRDTQLRVSGLSARYGTTEVLSDVTLTVGRDQCVALVGESGSGKTTLARCVVGLHTSWSGQVQFRGQDLPRSAQQRPPQVLQAIQYIFQNPYTALNPRKTIGQIIEKPLHHFYPSLSRSERDEGGSCPHWSPCST